MNMLIYLIPIALFMGAMGLVAFLWSLGSGQYDDLQGAAWRVLNDDEGDGRFAERISSGCTAEIMSHRDNQDGSA
jgi:cbb3-type cytochrome oxidase maturation protein